ncbi:Protein RocB [anaerobic digester metagenome]
MNKNRKKEEDKMNIREILYRLVQVQSDTGSVKENDMAQCIYGIIKEDEYFRKNPELCGMYHNDDFLGRAAVWALRRGTTDKTIVLSGHYDAVEIESYGTLKSYALNPDELKEKLNDFNLHDDAKNDLKDSDWLFGRGTCDMKAGIAIDIDCVLEQINSEVNVLFVGVHDEENLSAGMRQSTRLLSELKHKYNLDYKLVVITEPHGRKGPDTFKISLGSVGKIMPLIVVKGKIAHSSDVMEGLNSTAIMAEIISNMELNPHLCSTDRNMTTPPPTVLYARDMKETYDVSIPEYSSVFFNYQFLKSKTPEKIIEEVKDMCLNSMKTVIDKYNKAYDILNENYSLKGNNKRSYNPLVYKFEEIEKIASENNDNYITLKKELIDNINTLVRNNEISMQDAGILIVKRIIELSAITEPVAVIGIIPPYYPAVNNSYLSNNNEIFENTIEKVLSEHYGLKLEKESYFMGISDGSYTSCTNRKGEEEVMSNMVTSKEIYDIPFDYVENISAPVIVLGPWGKEYHTIYERVYMPDVEKTVPELIRKLINTI